MDAAHLAAIKLRSWTGDKGVYAKLFDRQPQSRSITLGCFSTWSS
jgi:hypothetical protein